MSLAVVIATALLVGYLGGRRSYRRKLQTTDGRQRTGMRRTDVRLDELLTPRTSEMPTVLMPRVAPATRPIPAQR